MKKVAVTFNISSIANFSCLTDDKSALYIVDSFYARGDPVIKVDAGSKGVHYISSKNIAGITIKEDRDENDN